MSPTHEQQAIEFFGAISAAIRAGELPLHLAVELDGPEPARLWQSVNFEIGGAGLTTALMPWRAGEAAMRVIERMTATRQDRHSRPHVRLGSGLGGSPIYQLDGAVDDTAQLVRDTRLLRQLWDGPFDAAYAADLEQRYKIDLWKYERQAFIEAVHLISYFRNPAGGIQRSVSPQQATTAARGGDAAARSLAWDVFHLAEDAGVPRIEIIAILRDFGPPTASEALEAAAYNARFNTIPR